MPSMPAKEALSRFAPQHGLLLIKPTDSERVGSIYMPQSASRSFPTTNGVVIAKGPGAITALGKRDPMDIEVGAKVLIRNGENMHPQLKIGGEVHLLVNFGDVLGTFEND